MGENPPVPDVDHTASESTASSSEQTDPMPEALRATEDTPQDTAADRQQAQSFAEEISEPEEVMV